MGKLSRLAIVLLTIVAAIAPIRAAAQTAAGQPFAASAPPSVPISAASPSALRTPTASSTPSIDHFFYGQPAAHAATVATPVAVTPAPPPANPSSVPPLVARASKPSAAIAKPTPSSPIQATNALGPHSIDHYFYGQPPGAPRVTASTPVAATTPIAAPTPAAAPTTIAAIIPPSPPAAAPAPSPSPAPAGHPDEGLRLYLSDPISATSNPFNWSVVASKSHHRIEVFYKRRLYRSYHAVFGRSHIGGPKLWEGDRRTPEGNYLIISKHRSARFRWFLKINYPNAVDQANFVQMKADGDIPRGMHEGDGVGIHGTDSPILNLGDIDWTTGCISIDNADIGELALLLPIGTLVVIKP